MKVTVTQGQAKDIQEACVQANRALSTIRMVLGLYGGTISRQDPNSTFVVKGIPEIYRAEFCPRPDLEVIPDEQQPIS